MTTFGAVCFCILMDHHKSGVEEAAPSYLAEKFEIMSRASDQDCFSMLDARNQDRVKQWAFQWSQKLP